jgi:hypothetical protein
MVQCFHSGFLLKEIARSGLDEYSKIQKGVATQILAQPRHNIFIGENFQKARGLCWSKDMEKEAQFKVDMKHTYYLTHPVLRQKANNSFYTVLHDIWDELAAVIQKEYQNDHVKALKEFVANYADHINYLIDDTERLEFNAAHLGEVISPTTYEQYSNIIGVQPYEILRGTETKTPTRKGLRKIINNIVNAYAIRDTEIKELPCTCKGECEVALLQMFPVGSNAKNVICYNSCLRTLFAAFKRATMQVFPPEKNELKKFGKFAMDMIDKYLDPHLKNFDYSFSEWYNKMPLKKQNDIDDAIKKYNDRHGPEEVKFGLFCKREKQEEGGKNRAIANIDPVTKYIMGPVTWALEDICDNYFPGYCGKKNWDMLESYYMNCEQDGFKYVLQGDGSAFDLSQHAEIKKYVDFYIYNKIYKHIHHVAPEDFRFAATNPDRVLDAKLMGKEVITLAKARIHGTVFSGASDTTLMNTLRMSLYNHYTLMRKGYEYDRDYRLLCKGDDFIVFTKTPTLKGQKYEDAYYEIWSKKAKSPVTTTYKPHGIGQILKFLIVGSITDIDFCSTCVIRDLDGSSLKIVRRPERMIVLDSYTRAGLKMSRAQFKQYLLDQALAMEISHGQLPFYRNYIIAFRAWAEAIPVPADTNAHQGKPSRKIPYDGHRQVKTPVEEVICSNYGHDFQRTFLSRYSTHTVSDEAVYQFLLDKYGITFSDIQYHLGLLLCNNTFNAIQESIDFEDRK